MPQQEPSQDLQPNSGLSQGFLAMNWLRRFQSSKRASSRVHRHTEAMLEKRYDNLKPEPDESEMSDTYRFNSPDTHTHYYEEKPKGLSTLAKLAVGAGLLSTGVGAGVGTTLLIDALAAKPEHTVSVETKTETMDWRLGQPIVE